MIEATGEGQVGRRIRGRPPSLRRVVVEALLVCLVDGLLVGLLWFLLAPQFSVEMVGEELRPSGPMGENQFGTDAWFAVISGVAGVLIALVLFTRHRHRPVATVCALAAAGLVGSAVAWRLGVLLGPDPVIGTLQDMADGTRLDLPLDLRASGLLLAWPIASVATVVVMSLLGDDQSRGRPTSQAGNVSRVDRSEPWSLP